MHDLELVSTQEWSLSHLTGLSHPFFSINTETIFNTWLVLIALTLFCFIIRFMLHYSHGIGRYSIMQCVYFFVDLCEQNLDNFSFKHFAFITSLFVFIFLCNICTIIPWLEEPTSDLNTTVALGITAFLYVQIAAIHAKGIKGYLSSYFKPFFLMLPLNVVGKLSSILSISFRLFGNIFGGSLITKIYFGTIGKWWLLEFFMLISGVNIVITGFFTLFEGTLQAFVFMMISLTYISLALQGDGH